MELKRTPLFEAHKNLGAKLVDFGGWEMPVQYSSIIEEHTTTREKAGLFDVSHMGEILVTGKDAKKYLNMLVTNDVNLLVPKKVIYTLIPNDNGGVVDDMLIYMMSDEEFLLVVNASNSDKDFAWFEKKFAKLSGGSVKVENQSAQYAQIALQGPCAQEILQTLVDYDLNKIEFFFYDYLTIDGVSAIVSRTGYTGEDGFEVYCCTTQVEKVWNKILEAGKPFGLCPVGLGARDTLRFEAGLPLYGHEISDTITPIEASLKFFTKIDKGDFCGKPVIEEQVVNGAKKKLIGLELIGKGVPRADYRIEKDGADIGYITSGTHSPTFKKGLAMVLIDTAFAKVGTEVDVVIRDNRVPAKIVKIPFYKKKTLQK